MFNNTNYNLKMGSNTQNVSFNTLSSGMIQRSHSKSIFIRFQCTSPYERMIFPLDTNVHAHMKSKADYKGDRETVDIDVLQVLIFGEDHCLVEVVKVSDLQEEIEIN